MSPLSAMRHEHQRAGDQRQCLALRPARGQCDLAVLLRTHQRCPPRDVAARTEFSAGVDARRCGCAYSKHLEHAIQPASYPNAGVKRDGGYLTTVSLLSATTSGAHHHRQCCSVVRRNGHRQQPRGGRSGHVLKATSWSPGERCGARWWMSVYTQQACGVSHPPTAGQRP